MASEILGFFGSIAAVFITVLVSMTLDSFVKLKEKIEIINGIRIELERLSSEICNFYIYNNSQMRFLCYKKELKRHFHFTSDSLLMRDNSKYQFFDRNSFESLTTLHLTLDKIDYLISKSENQDNVSFIDEVNYYLDECNKHITILQNRLKLNISPFEYIISFALLFMTIGSIVVILLLINVLLNIPATPNAP